MRCSRRFTAHFSEPLTTPVMVCWAAGLALLPALLIRLPLGHLPLYGRVLLDLVLSLLGGLTCGGLVMAAADSVPRWRRFVQQHQRVTSIAVRTGVGCALLLAVAGAVALGWSGEPVGAVARVVALGVLGCAVSACVVLLSFGPLLIGGRPVVMVVMRWGAGVLGLCLAVLVTLPLGSAPVGAGLLSQLRIIAMLVLFAWALGVLRTRTDFWRGPSAGAGLWVAVFSCQEDPGFGALAARVLAQLAIAGVLGTATVLLVRRAAGRRVRLRRFVGALSIVPLAYVLFLLFDDQLLGGPLEVPLFALMVWLAVRLWRWMGSHRRPLVSAAADIVLALLLGAVLVLFLVWLADVLDLPASEVGAVHRLATDLGSVIDLPWWVWAGADVLLTAMFLTVALGPPRFRRAAEALGRIRLAGLVDAVNRTLSGLKTVLLMVVFVGLAAPPSVGPVLSERVRDRYAVAYQEDIRARDTTAFYRAVTRRFTRSPQALPVLTEMLVRVNGTAPPRPGRDAPTPDALDLAHRMGDLEAGTVIPPPPPTGDGSAPRTPEPPTAEAVRDAGMAGTADDADDLDARLTAEQHEQEQADDRHQAAEQAAENAAAVVTSALSTVGLGHGVVIGLVREYLDGLAESALGNLFLSWADRGVSLTGTINSAEAERIVEPDPRSLRRAADLQLSGELIASGNLLGTDPAQRRAERESPIAAAVDLADQTRTQEHAAEHCADCARTGPEGDEERGVEVGGVHGE